MKYFLSYWIVAAFIAWAPIGESEAQDEPVTCKVSGTATLIDEAYGKREFAIGDIQGTATSGFGSWFHETGPDDGYIYFSLAPRIVSCRVDGVNIARSSGWVSETRLPVGGALNYVLEVEDMEPNRRWFDVLLEASRYAGEERIDWEDGELDGPVFLVVPSELPVTEGSAGNQWATLSFLPVDSDTRVTCRYRGTGETAIDSSDRYVIDSCPGAGRTLVGGEELEVEQIKLRVNGGSPFERTTVSLQAQIGEAVSDFLVLLIENSDEEVVFSFYGWADPDTGDFVVEPVR
jgi:hypothetical protein